MWPHSAHLRRCNHHPPRAKHSTQPVPLGSAAGLIPPLSDFIGSSLTSFCFSCFSSTGGHHRGFHVCAVLAVSEARLALPNFYKITIRIANVAARLAVLFLWLCDKLRSSISP